MNTNIEMTKSQHNSNESIYFILFDTLISILNDKIRILFASIDKCIGGFCFLSDSKRIYIIINTRHSLSVQCSILCHELRHAWDLMIINEFVEKHGQPTLVENVDKDYIEKMNNKIKLKLENLADNFVKDAIKDNKVKRIIKNLIYLSKDNILKV